MKNEEKKLEVRENCVKKLEIGNLQKREKELKFLMGY
jgi:hypothetical protein